MADPTKYKPHFNYSGWEAAGNKRPKPGAELDIDFANIARSVDETIDALKDIRRSDGKLKNGIVDKDALDESSRELWESAEVAAEDAKDSAQSAAGAAASASTSAELARGYVSDAVSQGNVPIYASAATVQGLEIPAGITAFRTNGETTPGDGNGSLYVESDASSGTLQSGDGRWWAEAAVRDHGTFSSVAEVQSRHIPPVLDSIRTNGYYTPGDGGGALYVEGDEGPAAIQSADGRWWLPAPNTVYVDSMPGATAVDKFYNAVRVVADGGRVIFTPGRTYDIERMVSVGPEGDAPAKNMTIDAREARFNLTDPESRFLIRSDITPLCSLSADYAPGDTSILVDVSGDAEWSSHYRRGSVFKIVSDAVQMCNRNTGDATNQHRVAEWSIVSRVEPVDSSTIRIHLWSPLIYDRGLSGEVAPPDPANREVVDSYTLQENARVFTVVQTNFEWWGGHFYVDNAWAKVTDNPSAWDMGTALNVQGFVRPVIKDLKVGAMPGKALMVSSYDPQILDPYVYGLPDISELEAHYGFTQSPRYLGYGIKLVACYAGHIASPEGRDTRHLIDGDDNTRPRGASSYTALMTSGRTPFTRVSQATAMGHYSAPIALHHATDWWVFTDPVVHGVENGYAISLRGRGHRVMNPVVRGAWGGLDVFTEWSGGDGFPGSSYRGDEGLSSATLVDGDFQCVGPTFRTIDATLRISGDVVVTQDMHTLSSARRLEIAGRLTAKLTGRAEYGSDSGIFEVDPYNPIYTPSEGHSVKFLPSAVVDIDASESQNGGRPLHVFGGDSMPLVQVDGFVSITGNPEFTTIYRTNAARRSRDTARLSILGVPVDAVDRRSVNGGWITIEALGVGQVARYNLTTVGRGIGGVVEVIADRSGANLCGAAVFNAPDQTATEYCELIGGGANFKATNNTDFSDINDAVDGALTVSYLDGSLYFANRTNFPITIRACVRLSTDIR